MNKLKYVHTSLNLVQKNKIIFTAHSKKTFYLRVEIAQFVLQQGETPINPFLNFDYNMAGVVDKSLIRASNNTLVGRCDELWVFGDVSDGVLTEIYMAKKRGTPVRYFVRLREAQFREIDEAEVRLEDVSDELWQYMRSGRDLARWHPRLRFNKTYPLVYPAYSKHNFYLQNHINQFCLEKRSVPLNPFMLFRYFLGDSVPRETVYRANNNIVRIADAVWSFGEVSDGVLAEIVLKKDQGGQTKHYKLASSNSIAFRAISPDTVVFENYDRDLERYRALLS